VNHNYFNEPVKPGDALENNKSEVRINLGMGGVLEHSVMNDAYKAMLIELHEKVEALRYEMRRLQDGPLDAPELQIVMKEFWNNSLELGLYVSDILEMNSWVMASEELKEVVKKELQRMEKKQ